MARWRAVVFDADQEQTAVGIGKRRDVLGNSVPHRPAFDLLRFIAASIPGRLELQKLPLLPRQEIPKLAFGEHRRRHSVHPTD